jgi:hypothetical protein
MVKADKASLCVGIPLISTDLRFSEFDFKLVWKRMAVDLSRRAVEDL